MSKYKCIHDWEYIKESPYFSTDITGKLLYFDSRQKNSLHEMGYGSCTFYWDKICLKCHKINFEGLRAQIAFLKQEKKRLLEEKHYLIRRKLAQKIYNKMI